MQVAKKYKHLIWDLDHTLWDFNTNSEACISELIKEFKLDEEFIKSISAFYADYIRINDECWALYREEKLDKSTLRDVRFQKSFQLHGASEERSAELAKDFGKEYVKRCPHKTALIPNAKKVLTELSARGYNQVILTNGFLEAQEVKMVDSGLRPFFSHEFVSEIIGAKKPYPLAYYAVTETLNAEVSECLMIGDSALSDIKGAVNVGMDSVHFLPDGLQPSEATYKIQHLEELLEFL